MEGCLGRALRAAEFVRRRKLVVESCGFVGVVGAGVWVGGFGSEGGEELAVGGSGWFFHVGIVVTVVVVVVVAFVVSMVWRFLIVEVVGHGRVGVGWLVALAIAEEVVEGVSGW